MESVNKNWRKFALVKEFQFHRTCQVRNGNLLKSRISEICVKRIRVNQGVGVSKCLKKHCSGLLQELWWMFFMFTWSQYIWLFDGRVRQGKKVLPEISCPTLPVAQNPLRHFNVLHIFEIFESSLKTWKLVSNVL